MKHTVTLVLCSLLVTLLVYCSQVNCAKPMSTPANDPELIKRINSNPNNSWKARVYKRFNGLVQKSFQAVYGKRKVSNNKKQQKGQSKKNTSTKNKNKARSSKVSSNKKTPTKVKKVKTTNKKTKSGASTLESSTSTEPLTTPQDIPTQFDSREKWPNCVLPLRDQGLCGSCWAFATSGAFAQRMCVATNGKIKEEFSPDYLVKCITENFKCIGGTSAKTWKFIEDVGIPTEKCVKYSLKKVQDNSMVGGCPTSCENGNPIQLYKTVAGSFRNFLNSDEKIKRSIMTFGHVVGSIVVYRDFLNFDKGIYSRNSDTELFVHYVQIIGWGVEEGTGKEYWTILNSWGDWGENNSGTIRIQKGQIGVEKFVFGPSVIVP